MKRAFFLVVVAAILAGLIGGLYWFQFAFKPAMIRKAIQSMPQPTQAVAVVKARQDSWAPMLTEIGSLRAISQIDLASQVGGIIRAIKFDTAQDVEKGAPLVEIDDSTEQADLKAGLAALRNAEATLQRQAQLQSGGAASKAALDNATAARDSAAAQVERTRAIIAQKSISAPFSGRLGIRRVDVGQYVTPGATLVTLQQLDPIYVDFQAPEQRIGALKVGQKIEMTTDAFPGKTFTGAVKYLDARISADTRQFLVRSEVPNKDKSLRPGMFANVTISIGAPAAVVVVPRTAVDFSLYGDSVYVAKPEAEGSEFAKLERRFVRLGQTRGFDVAIADGLSVGEIVVSAGQLKLANGMRVKMDTKAALAPLTPLPKE